MKDIEEKLWIILRNEGARQTADAKIMQLFSDYQQSVIEKLIIEGRNMAESNYITGKRIETNYVLLDKAIQIIKGETE